MQLTERDEELLVTLLRVRYLSRAQIRELLFAGASEQVVSRRLGILLGRRGGAESPPLQSVRVRRWKGWFDAYCLTAEGFRHAQLLDDSSTGTVPESRRPAGEEFLEHLVQTNQLYVDLVRDKTPLVRRGRARSFRWIPAGAEAALEYRDGRRSSRRNRVIMPDAILEAERAKLRFLIEVERGGNPVKRIQSAGNSLVGKLDRYATFVSGYASPASQETWYTRRFTDGWPPTVAFLVATEQRAETIQARLRRHVAKVGESRYPDFRIWSYGEASAAIGAMALPQSFRKKDPEQRNDPDDFLRAIQELALDGRLRSFVEGAVSVIQSVRHGVREGKTVQREPEYPPGTQAVLDAVDRLPIAANGREDP